MDRCLTATWCVLQAAGTLAMLPVSCQLQLSAFEDLLAKYIL